MRPHPHVVVFAAALSLSLVATVILLQISSPVRVQGESDTPEEVEGSLSPTSTPGPLVLDGLPSRLQRSQSVGALRVAVAFLDPDYLTRFPEVAGNWDPRKFLVFQVAVDGPFTPPVSDLKGMIFLRDGGFKEYGNPTWLPKESGPSKSGIAAFTRQDARGNPVPAADSRFLEIVIRGLHGAREVSFRWDFPTASP